MSIISPCKQAARIRKNAVVNKHMPCCFCDYRKRSELLKTPPSLNSPQSPVPSNLLDTPVAVLAENRESIRASQLLVTAQSSEQSRNVVLLMMS